MKLTKSRLIWKVFYSSLYQDPNKVVVTCYGPEATNIHGVDESISLDSMKEVGHYIAVYEIGAG